MTDPLVALLTRMAIILRISAAVFVTAAALLSITSEHAVATIVALLVYGAMSTGYVLVVRSRGFVMPLVVADVLTVTGIALAMRWLVPAGWATSPAGWVFNAVSFVVILAQWAGRFRWTVPLGAVAIAAFVTGAQLADAPDRGIPAAFTLVLQVGLAAGLVAILRAAGRQAQAAARQHHETAREQEAARLRRNAERTALTLLHNGPLTTLTLVAQGGLSTRTVAAVRTQAAVDLAMLGGESATDTIESVQLADLIDRTAAIMRHRLEITLTTSPCLVPTAVAQAFAGAMAEALENVARHSGAGAATVQVEATDERVTVAITDTGRGFDPARVPANRFGLRESITGQLARVDGLAVIHSEPTAGTTIILTWPDHT